MLLNRNTFSAAAILIISLHTVKCTAAHVCMESLMVFTGRGIELRVIVKVLKMLHDSRTGQMFVHCRHGSINYTVQLHWTPIIQFALNKLVMSAAVCI